MSCPETRRAFVSAAREIALDPAFGPMGVWTRLEQLRIPAAFVWGDKDRFIPMKDIPNLAEIVPGAFQIHVSCAGHFDNGPHFRCMEHGAIEAVRLVEAASRRSRRTANKPEQARVAECVVAIDECEAATIHAS
jgi:pimeloyl-ACP methyl ester carboxylesterase